MDFLRNLFGKKKTATTSSSSESSQPAVASSNSRSKTPLVAAKQGKSECDHEWVRVVETSGSTLMVTTKCKKCGRTPENLKTEVHDFRK